MKTKELRVKEMRAMDGAKQSTELKSLLKEQFSLRMQHATGQLPNTSQIKKVRRDVARLRTIMNEKK
jgi:large subunit ribosomal protein L29